jgi:hypothetical protein
MAQSFKSILKIAFENTTMAARSNPPQEAYEYAEKMKRMCLNSLNTELQGVCTLIEQGSIKQALEVLKTMAVDQD